MDSLLPAPFPNKRCLCQIFPTLGASKGSREEAPKKSPFVKETWPGWGGSSLMQTGAEDIRRWMCGLRGYQPGRSWSYPSSAKARKEVKLDMELKVRCKPILALFPRFCAWPGTFRPEGGCGTNVGLELDLHTQRGTKASWKKEKWWEQCADVSPADLIPFPLHFPEIMLWAAVSCLLKQSDHKAPCWGQKVIYPCCKWAKAQRATPLLPAGLFCSLFLPVKWCYLEGEVLGSGEVKPPKCERE